MVRQGTYSIILVAALAIGGVYIATQYMGTPSKQPGQPAENQPIVAVTVPALSGPAKIGEVAFNAKCAACHGTNAAGREGVAPPLVHKIYEPSHHGDGAFLLAAQNGVRAHHWPFGNMPPVDGVTNGDVKNIVAYVRALQRENGIH